MCGDVRRAKVAVWLGLAMLVASAGCRHKSKTPEEAYARFSAAVTAGDGAALFDALDQKSRLGVDVDPEVPARGVRHRPG